METTTNETNKRISIEECLDILGYALGEKKIDYLKKHFARFGDWVQIKDLIIKDFVKTNADRQAVDKLLKRVRRENEMLKQGDFYHPEKWKDPA